MPARSTSRARSRSPDWQKLGVRNADGSDLPVAALTASLVAPDGPSGPAYLVYGNYKVVMRWNRSTYFATSVGLLADQARRRVTY